MLTIYLPDSFKQRDKVWVKHNNTVFGGDSGLEVTLVNEKPCVVYEHTERVSHHLRFQNKDCILTQFLRQVIIHHLTDSQKPVLNSISGK